MENGIIEDAITSILDHYKAHFDLKQKFAHLFFHEIGQFEEWMLRYIL